jgi:hypothetical protein
VLGAEILRQRDGRRGQEQRKEQKQSQETEKITHSTLQGFTDAPLPGAKAKTTSKLFGCEMRLICKMKTVAGGWMFRGIFGVQHALCKQKAGVQPAFCSVKGCPFTFRLE